MKTLRAYYDVLSTDGFVSVSGCTRPAHCEEGALLEANEYLARNHAGKAWNIRLVVETETVSRYSGNILRSYDTLEVR